jgi:oxalate decarboxylase
MPRSSTARVPWGAIRELHWHKEAEWAYMLAGSARVTCIDPEGRNFIDDVNEGDLRNFRAGLPHSIQALADGCEFLIVFDNGMFSENETFLLTDWTNHTPMDVLAKNVGVSPSALANIHRDPNHERYIFNGQVPPPLAKNMVRAPAGEAMQMTWRLVGQDPVEVPGGRIRVVDSTTFHAASTIARCITAIPATPEIGLHAVELQRVYQQVKSIGQLASCVVGSQMILANSQ